ncbi:hypothetical protein HL670_01957 [Serratia plymuthica]|jgi:hypothetical protein|uniref:Uncharacterized protein n=1 Tax=Serratia plymuthica TaxID=82996 RepID=A0A318P399_SERPL|nr:hypothetical protein [Serratia plymuthica]KYG13988.1 hypothetical protein SOD10_50140 [Serratia plymuthica]OJT47426.1 hypothetical protein BSR04_01165 [Serratia plymuthica]PYD40589.1 hypothetical protein CT690_04690 [Serratia plymuthica]QJW55073.1 hypothetical protein HL670_01957 [Serratia plymuthica]UJD99883.1 hypothetical protein FS592_15325 [Serratia plymuthica]
MDKIIRPIIIFFAILSISPFLSGAGVLTPGSVFSAPAGISKFMITLATGYFFVSLSLKLYDFLRKSK